MKIIFGLVSFDDAMTWMVDTVSVDAGADFVAALDVAAEVVVVAASATELPDVEIVLDTPVLVVVAVVAVAVAAVVVVVAAVVVVAVVVVVAEVDAIAPPTAAGLI
jgi:hypothetical protein